MADGDLLLTLRFDAAGYVPGPPDPEPPPMGSCGAELYAALEPLAWDDHNQRWALAHLCEAIGRMRQAVSDLVRDSEQTVVIDGREVEVEVPGWSRATDVDLAPGSDAEIDLLPFVGQLAGVRDVENLSEEDRRSAIRAREGFRRGQPAAVLSFARRFMVDGRGVTLRERYDARLGAGTDAPYHGQVRIKRSRIKPGVDELDLRQRVLATIPAGLVYDVVISDTADFEQVRQDFDDFHALADAFADFDALADYAGD
jgi:hypothetical protein